jgi:hypothetical protein
VRGGRQNTQVRYSLAENGAQAMVVEAKAKLDKADIDEQIIRMEKVRRYADLRGDTRQFYCAMATMAAKKQHLNMPWQTAFI